MRAYAMLKLLLIAGCLIAALPSHAATTKYQVEVLIFEDSENRYINSELWPRLEIELSPDELPAELRADMQNNSDSNKTIRGISKRKNRLLTKQAKKIRNSKNHRILLHKSWRQSGLSEKAAINVPVSSVDDENYSATGSSISGTIKLVLGRYLHVYTDLIYRKPMHEFSTGTSRGYRSHKDFAIKAHRRMRSREIHYLDHPLVGILVTVVPVK